MLDAEADQRKEWMVDTIEYLSERYPSLSKEELGQLKEIGIRYCAPAIPHGDGDEAQVESEAETEPTAETESAGTQEVEPVTKVDEVEDVEPAAKVEEEEESDAELEEGERDEVGVA